LTATGVMPMRTNVAERLDWPVVGVVPRPGPDPEPQDLTACLAGPNGLELIVELAHDLRSPLTSILFLAEALQQGQGGTVTPEQNRQLGLIYSAALSLCATASDVLELARGGNRLVDRAPAPFSVAETFASVRSMIQPIAEEKGLKVQLVHPVPERRVGQERALSRVLLNLATNAVKFTDSGFVEVAARPVDVRRLEFSVRDTGAGIDPALLRSLYQPVRPAPAGGNGNGRHHFSSSGLGLAICRRLVSAMGAELQVETRPNWGTRFFFEVDCPSPESAAA
jgi:signal transduction histidine kinase